MMGYQKIEKVSAVMIEIRRVTSSQPASQPASQPRCGLRIRRAGKNTCYLQHQWTPLLIYWNGHGL